MITEFFENRALFEFFEVPSKRYWETVIIIFKQGKAFNQSGQLQPSRRHINGQRRTLLHSILIINGFHKDTEKANKTVEGTIDMTKGQGAQFTEVETERIIDPILIRTTQ